MLRPHEVHISIIHAATFVLNIKNTGSADPRRRRAFSLCPRFCFRLCHRDTCHVRTHQAPTRQCRGVANSLGLDVSLLSHGVGDLLAVVVLLLGFDQLLHRLLQLGLNAAQLIDGLCRRRGREEAKT